jgi:tetratricopeptide (TPR) repeat protein
MSDLRGAAEAAIGAGNVLEEQGRWDEAERWYRAALRTLEGVDGPAPERWHALLTLHIVARTRGAVEASIPLLEQAEEAAESVDPGSSIQFIENARGQLLMARGDYRAAEWAFRTALDGAEHARARVVIRLNLSEACLAQGRTLDAAEEAREAEREAIRERVVPKLPEVYRLLGRIATAEDNPDAFVLFERALALTEERNLPTLEKALTLQAYAESEARRGDTDAALQLRDQARELFAAAGVTHERQRWADVFDTASDEDSPIAGPAS